MKINLEIFSNKLSGFGFFLLFPIYFIYHFCLSQYYFPPILGGLFGIVSLVISILAFFILPWFLKNRIRFVKLPVYVFYLTIVFFLFWTFVNHFLVESHPYGYHAFWESYSSFVIWTAMFFIGFFLPVGSQKFFNSLKKICFLIFLIFLFSIYKENSFFALFNFFQKNMEISSLSSYQQAGRSVLLSFLFYALICRNIFFTSIILLICPIILFSIGSRTDLISAILVLLLYFSHLLFKGKGSFLKKISIFLSFIVGLVCVFLIIKTSFYDSRASELFDLASSSSWQGRSDLSSNAILIINKNPIFGKFDYYSDAGGYAHNILSAWTSFGLFGFLLYFSLLIYFLTVSMYNYLLNNKFNEFWLLVFSFNLIVFFQALFAAPIFFVLPPLGWGLTLNVYLISKVKNRIN